MENFMTNTNTEQPIEFYEVKKTKKKPNHKKTYYIPTDIQKKMEWLSKNSDNKNSSRILCDLINLEYDKQNNHNKEHIQKMDSVVDDNFILQSIALENQELKDKLDGLQKFFEEIVMPAIENKNNEIDTMNKEIGKLKTDTNKLEKSFAENKQKHFCAMKNVGATFQSLDVEIVKKYEVKEIVDAEGSTRYETVNINKEVGRGGNNDPTN